MWLMYVCLSLRALFVYRYIEEAPMLDECTMVDPRFKSTPYLSTEERAALQDRIIQKMISIKETIANTPTSNDDNNCEGNKLKNASGLGQVLGDLFVDSAMRSFSLEETVTWELRQYMQENLCEINESPFTWWEQRACRFPTLSILAASLLSIQATSVPSERIFSTAGELINAKRNSLDSDMVDKILFLNKNKEKFPK